MTSTITMLDIAKLAGVSRSTVTVWRGRFGKTAKAPFPEPIESDTHQLLFNPIEVGKWLVTTGHGRNTDAHMDALLYSSLFATVMENPVEAAQILEQWDYSDSASNSILGQSLAELIEAGFGAKPVLKKLQDSLWQRDENKLHNSAVGIIAEVLRIFVDTQKGDMRDKATIVSRGIASLPVLVELARSYSEGAPFRLVHADELAELDKRQVALCELSVHEVDIQSDGNHFPSNALLLGIWLSVTSVDPETFFQELEDQLLNLDSMGSAVIIAPAELLLGEEASIVAARKRFLSDTETGAVAPLRYSARLPRGWAVNLGQRQLALWIFKWPHDMAKVDFPVAIAELSDFSEPDHKNLVSDIASVILSADDLRKHNFVKAYLTTGVKALRSHRLTYDAWLNQEAAPSKVAGKILSLADKADLPWIEQFPLEQMTDSDLIIESIGWNKATKGPNRMLEIISGNRLLDMDLNASGEGTVSVIGVHELNDTTRIGTRRIDRLQLEKIYPSARLTEPGDVVFINKGRTNNGKTAAIIDHDGGHLVQSPARVARCRSFQGRSRKPLKYVTTPYFTVQAIKTATSYDSSSWLVPSVKTELLSTLTDMHQQVNQRRSQLLSQLRALDKFEQEFAAGLASGSIRAGPEHR